MTPRIKTGSIPQISNLADNAKDMLRCLIESEGHPVDTIRGADLQAIAERLRAYAPAGKQAKWNKDYLANIISGRQAASGTITQAIAAMLEAKKGVPEVWAKAAPMVLSVNAVVKPGALVTVDSRDCNNPACGRPFIPRSGNQKFCNPQCRKEAKKAQHGN